MNPLVQPQFMECGSRGKSHYLSARPVVMKQTTSSFGASTGLCTARRQGGTVGQKIDG
jgi:hypothetical protein